MKSESACGSFKLPARQRLRVRAAGTRRAFRRGLPGRARLGWELARRGRPRRRRRRGRGLSVPGEVAPCDRQASSQRARGGYYSKQLPQWPVARRASPTMIRQSRCSEVKTKRKRIFYIKACGRSAYWTIAEAVDDSLQQNKPAKSKEKWQKAMQGCYPRCRPTKPTRLPSSAGPSASRAKDPPIHPEAATAPSLAGGAATTPPLRAG